MSKQRMLLKSPVAFVVGTLSIFLITACGATTTGNAASATATACSTTSQFRATTGTLQSINGNTLQISERQGQSIKATYDSNTRFTREALVASTAIKTGTQITVVVKQNSDNTYTATRISLGARQFPNAPGGQGTNGNNNAGQGGRNLRNRANCPTGGQSGRGNNGNSTNPANNNNNNTRGISGTVGQISGSTLTVTDASNDDYTVSLDKTTNISETQSASASDLHPGVTISILGKPASNGTITAQTITIILATNNPARNN